MLLSVLGRWFCCCWFVVDCYSHYRILQLFYILLLYVHSCFAIILMGKRESWLLCLVCLPGVLWLLCGYSNQCHGFVCSLWLWYSLTIFECNSCEQRWPWRICTFVGLVWAFVTVKNSHVVTEMAIECHFVRAAKDMASLHICTGLP